MNARVIWRAGESNERLDGLGGWRESPNFTEAEKAAREGAEGPSPATKNREPATVISIAP